MKLRIDFDRNNLVEQPSCPRGRSAATRSRFDERCRAGRKTQSVYERVRSAGMHNTMGFDLIACNRKQMAVRYGRQAPDYRRSPSP